jgi:DNA-directed RNA polymerase subunit RPC12/RpoP
MGKSKEIGEAGEKEIIKKIACPNCEKKLMLLPKNYPLFDVQCTGCSFRAQIKTVSSQPKNTFFGAGWEIMNKVLKSGYMVPPLLVNFVWKNHQEIRFYPFIPRLTLTNYQLSSKARRANYKMFHYTEMNKLPYFILYQK